MCPCLDATFLFMIFEIPWTTTLSCHSSACDWGVEFESQVTCFVVAESPQVMEGLPLICPRLRHREKETFECWVLSTLASPWQTHSHIISRDKYFESEEHKRLLNISFQRLGVTWYLLGLPLLQAHIKNGVYAWTLFRAQALVGEEICRKECKHG